MKVEGGSYQHLSDVVSGFQTALQSCPVLVDCDNRGLHQSFTSELPKCPHPTLMQQKEQQDPSRSKVVFLFFPFWEVEHQVISCANNACFGTCACACVCV